ncbi:MAG: glycosyltransferase family 2 protein [Mesorhizobium sp.]
MIVRNEERFLPGCLASLGRQVDEIVIVDTGSDDHSREIALDGGAVMIDHPWRSDFAEARNVALDRATGDWILYIDADERLVVPEPGALRHAVALPETVAGRVRFRPRVAYTPYREIRLFRRDERIRFRGRIHETVHPAIDEVARSDGMRLADLEIGIDHLGYEGDLAHKHARNLPLLEAAVGDEPGRVFLWADMARSLSATGRRQEAEAACRRAIALSAAARSNAKQYRDGAIAWLELIGLHVETNAEAAARLAREAVAAFPEDMALRLAAARTAFATGEVEAALTLADALAAIDADSFIDPLMAYDKRIFGEWALDLKGAALLRLGRRAEAADAFRRAGELAPDDPAYRFKAIAASGRP